MEMSVREARAQFAAALAAVERGERVTITKHGVAVAELGPVPARKALDWNSLERFRKAQGWETLTADEIWPADFNDSDSSRAALMLDENPDIEPR